MPVPTDLRYFKPSEWPKDPSKVDPRLCYALDAVREAAGAPISIHVAWDKGGHAANSFHYRGLAVDFHFLGPIPPVHQLNAILPVPEIMGIGRYPSWAHPGWHVDLRPSPRLFWVEQDGRYVYFREEHDFRVAAGLL